MLTELRSDYLPTRGLRAWNSHDLEGIMSHYTPEIVLTSPVAARLLNDDGGMTGEFMELDATSKAIKVVPNYIP